MAEIDEVVKQGLAIGWNDYMGVMEGSDPAEAEATPETPIRAGGSW